MHGRSNTQPRISSLSGAFSLLELLVAVALGVLLVTSVVAISDIFRKQAKKARCISNLRTLHLSLSAYQSEQGHWPQMDDEDFEATEKEFFRFWVTATEPYGANQETWICPSDRSLLERKKLGEPDDYYGSYVPTRFDSRPSTPLRWNQPWVMERGNLHGKGAHILMPDGSVTESQVQFHGR